MPWGAGAYTQFFQEDTYGTFPATIDPTKTLTFEIIGDDQWKIRRTALTADVRTAHKGNRRARRVSHRHTVQGSLTTWLYPSQTQHILDWALQDQSWSCQTFNTIVQEQFLGIKVRKITLSAAADQQEGEVKCVLDLVGQTQGTAVSSGWAKPADNLYPYEDAWALTDTPGHLEFGTSAGNVRTRYKDFSLEITNILDATFDETPYIRTCTYAGRDVTLSFTPQFLNHDDLDAFLAQSTVVAKLGFQKGTGGTAKTLTFDFKTLNKIDRFDYTLPLASRSYSPITMGNFVDNPNTDDFTYTVSLGS